MTYKPVDTAIVFLVGPAIDDSDFKSLEEAIAYDAAGMDVSLIVEKTDGTSAVTAITLTTGGTSDWTHKDGGYYEIEVTAAQNAEEGTAYIRGVCTGVLPFESAHVNIVPANVYNSLIKGTDTLQADVTQWLGSAAEPVVEVDVTHIHGTAITETVGGYLAAGFTKLFDVATPLLVASDVMRGTDGANATTPPTVIAIRQEIDANSTRLDADITSRAPASEYDTEMGYIPSNLGDVPTATELNNAHGAGSWATATGFSTHAAADVWGVTTRILTASTNFHDLSAADVNAEIDTALADINLDHLMKLAVDTNWATTVHLDSALGHIADVGTAATFDRTEESLEAIRARGDAEWDTATGFNTTTPPTVVAIREEMDANSTKMAPSQVLADYKATGFNTVVPDAAGVAPTVNEIVTGIFDRVTEGTLTFEELQRIIYAYAAGKSNGGGTTTARYRNSADTKDRIVATVTSEGNRDAVTVDGT